MPVTVNCSFKNPANVSVCLNSEANDERNCVKEAEANAGGSQIHCRYVVACVKEIMYRHNARNKEGHCRKNDDGAEIAYRKSGRAALRKKTALKQNVDRRTYEGKHEDGIQRERDIFHLAEEYSGNSKCDREKECRKQRAIQKIACAPSCIFVRFSHPFRPFSPLYHIAPASAISNFFKKPCGEGKSGV